MNRNKPDVLGILNPQVLWGFLAVSVGLPPDQDMLPTEFATLDDSLATHGRPHLDAGRLGRAVIKLSVMSKRRREKWRKHSITKTPNSKPVRRSPLGSPDLLQPSSSYGRTRIYVSTAKEQRTATRSETP